MQTNNDDEAANFDEISLAPILSSSVVQLLTRRSNRTMTIKPDFDAELQRVKPAFPVIPGKPAAKKWAPEGARRRETKICCLVAISQKPALGPALAFLLLMVVSAFAVGGEVKTFTLFFFRHTQTNHDINQFEGDD